MQGIAVGADTLDNLGGRISSQKEVLLDARKDIDIVGGTLDAGDRISLKAGRDIDVRTTTSTATTPNGLATTMGLTGWRGLA